MDLELSANYLFLDAENYIDCLDEHTLECIGKLNLLKAQLCAFNTTDSTTIPLTVQRWQITSYVPDSTDFVVDSSSKCLTVRTVGMPLCPGFHKNVSFAK